MLTRQQIEYATGNASHIDSVADQTTMTLVRMYHTARGVYLITHDFLTDEPVLERSSFLDYPLIKCLLQSQIPEGVLGEITSSKSKMDGELPKISSAWEHKGKTYYYYGSNGNFLEFVESKSNVPMLVSYDYFKEKMR